MRGNDGGRDEKDREAIPIVAVQGGQPPDAADVPVMQLADVASACCLAVRASEVHLAWGLRDLGGLALNLQSS